jgi:hypothetical protein
VWTSDTIGEYRFEVCDVTNHRRYNFVGGLKKPYIMAWLDEKDNFNHIQIRLESENRKRRISEPVSKRTLQKFISDWKFVVNANYHPEFFYKLPWREAGLNYENLPKLQKVNDQNIDAILDKLILEEDPFYPEPDIQDDDFVTRFKQQKKQARLRFNACVKCQKISRDKENEFFTGLESVLQTPHIEQKWLVIIALHFYMRNQIKDTEAFYDFVFNNLLSKYYLIRKETFEMIRTHILVQPESAFIIVEKLLNEKDINLKMYGISLLQYFARFIGSVTTDVLYLRHPYPIKVNKSFAERLFPLYDIAFEIQESIISHFQKMKRYKNLALHPQDTFDYFYNSKEPAFEKAYNMNLLLRPLYRLKKPFEKYEHK